MDDLGLAVEELVQSVSADSQLLSRLPTPALRRSPRFSLGTVPFHAPVSWSAPRGRSVPRPQPQRQGQGFST